MQAIGGDVVGGDVVHDGDVHGADLRAGVAGKKHVPKRSPANRRESTSGSLPLARMGPIPRLMAAATVGIALADGVESASDVATEAEEER